MYTVDVTKTLDPHYRKKTIARDILAGTIAGINVTFIGHPFDTIKVRLQTQPTHPPLYNGLIDCLKKTVEWEGVSGLYKGVTSPLAGQMAFRATMFLSFAESKILLKNGSTRDNTVPEIYLSGAIAWVAGAFVECPIELLKSQIQVQIIKEKRIPNYISPYKSMHHCAQLIYRTNGVKGLYQGFVPHLMRNIPGGALHLGTFELVRTKFARMNNVSLSELSTTQNLLSGACGGIAFWSFCYPFDVVKSAFQTDSIERDKRKYSKVVDTWKALYNDGGIRRFFRGFSACMLRAIPANAVMCWTSVAVQNRIPVSKYLDS